MDPGSIAGVGLAIVLLAVQSIKSLKDTVTRYKGCDKTLARLYHVLEDLDSILETLEQAICSEALTRALLEGPVSRCSLLCREFETAMQAFSGRSKMGFRDWTKMEFMTGDINEFMDRLAGYKSTISVGLGTITIQGPSEAQLLMRRTLNESRDNIAQTIGRLQEHLEYMAISGTPKSDLGYQQLEGDLQTSKQCLELCKNASEQVAYQKVYTVGEMVTDGDSDQVVITTLADLFDVKKASSTNGSAQWIGSLSEETARQVSKDRYSSRFGAVVTNGTSNVISSMPLISNTREVNSIIGRRSGKAGQPAAREAVQRRSPPNEMRKRAAEDGDEKEER
ncbi:hypothetical protein FAUST_9496 [Fusarium austroamericanum]|uniref:Azaphilone pigments biosynthesis cluster protein L N-terminal domain-containing protein n=1 Tax=Fusarium austroamericanum TaxID=282268 RepID=A0AAN6BWK8_FUSAU|nr:hypothetical protein FAUST_9496 [Fusarium austroamericanum]